MHVYPSRDDIVYLKGEDSIKAYCFTDKRVEHKFCPNCGSSISVDPHGALGGPDIVSMNVRMFQDVEIEKLKVKTTNGKAYPPAYNPE
ncbi:MAG: hypothetical protein Q9170_000937 [Blastenia crenularia]